MRSKQVERSQLLAKSADAHCVFHQRVDGRRHDDPDDEGTDIIDELSTVLQSKPPGAGETATQNRHVEQAPGNTQDTDHGVPPRWTMAD